MQRMTPPWKRCVAPLMPCRLTAVWPSARASGTMLPCSTSGKKSARWWVKPEHRKSTSQWTRWNAPTTALTTFPIPLPCSQQHLEAPCSTPRTVTWTNSLQAPPLPTMSPSKVAWRTTSNRPCTSWTVKPRTFASWRLTANGMLTCSRKSAAQALNFTFSATVMSRERYGQPKTTARSTC